MTHIKRFKRDAKAENQNKQGRVQRKGDPHARLAATVGNSVEEPQEVRGGAALGLSNPASGYLSKGNEDRTSKRDLHLHTHGSIIHNSQGMKTT